MPAAARATPGTFHGTSGRDPRPRPDHHTLRIARTAHRHRHATPGRRQAACRVQLDGGGGRNVRGRLDPITCRRGTRRGRLHDGSSNETGAETGAGAGSTGTCPAKCASRIGSRNPGPPAGVADAGTAATTLEGSGFEKCTPTNRFGARRWLGKFSLRRVLAHGCRCAFDRPPLLEGQFAATAFAVVARSQRFRFTFVAAHDTSRGVQVERRCRNGKGPAKREEASLCHRFAEDFCACSRRERAQPTNNVTRRCRKLAPCY